MFKKLASQFFHSTDLLYQVFSNDDTYLRETICATCELSRSELDRIEQAVQRYYKEQRLAPILAKLEQKRAQNRKEEKKALESAAGGKKRGTKQPLKCEKNIVESKPEPVKKKKQSSKSKKKKEKKKKSKKIRDDESREIQDESVPVSKEDPATLIGTRKPSDNDCSEEESKKNREYDPSPAHEHKQLILDPRLQSKNQTSLERDEEDVKIDDRASEDDSKSSYNEPVPKPEPDRSCQDQLMQEHVYEDSDEEDEVLDNRSKARCVEETFDDDDDDGSRDAQRLKI